jgi:UDP-N-acetylmuramate--alanine ligase
VKGGEIAPETTQPNGFIYHGIEFEVPIIGRHNLENALCVVRLCEQLGLDMMAVRKALASFQGIERRLEIIGRTNGITIIDDYAHNPAKISAALSAASETAPRVHAFWRPHGFTPLHLGMAELATTFSHHLEKHGGSVFILPVFYAGGTVERKATSMDLVQHLNAIGTPARFAADYESLKRELEMCASPGDTILGMGARDPELPRFARRLVTEWKVN